MTNPNIERLSWAIAHAWGNSSQEKLGRGSGLDVRHHTELPSDSTPDEMGGFFDQSRIFAVQGTHGADGLVVLLIRREDIERLTGAEDKVTALTSFLNHVFSNVASDLSNDSETHFGEVLGIDPSTSEVPVRDRLLGARRDTWAMSTMGLNGENLGTEIKCFYIPQASIEVLQPDVPEVENEPIAIGAAAAASAGGFPSGRPDPGRNIERILDVELEVVVRFGLTQMPLKELVRVGVGSMIELNRQVDEPVEVLVNDRVLARGSVVVVDGYYGVCISEIGLPEERRLSLARNI